MIEDAAAVDALLEALEDEDTEVRKQAIWALMRCIDHDDVDYGELAAKLRRALIGGGGASTPGLSR
jgi:HEAT repeat protein